MSNPNHTLTCAQAINLAAEGKDPFAGVSTAFLLTKWREFVADGKAHFLNFPPEFAAHGTWDSRRDCAIPLKEELEYYKFLKTELDKRPNLLNKKEGKEKRRAMAKAGR
jgi:hypothetical protein